MVLMVQSSRRSDEDLCFGCFLVLWLEMNRIFDNKAAGILFNGIAG